MRSQSHLSVTPTPDDLPRDAREGASAAGSDGAIRHVSPSLADEAPSDQYAGHEGEGAAQSVVFGRLAGMTCDIYGQSCIFSNIALVRARDEKVRKLLFDGICTISVLWHADTVVWFDVGATNISPPFLPMSTYILCMEEYCGPNTSVHFFLFLQVLVHFVHGWIRKKFGEKAQKGHFPTEKISQVPFCSGKEWKDIFFAPTSIQTTVSQYNNGTRRCAEPPAQPCDGEALGGQAPPFSTVHPRMAPTSVGVLAYLNYMFFIYF
jgi:hypothetical protein